MCHYLEVCCEADQQVQVSIIPEKVINEVSDRKCGYRFTEGIGLRIAEDNFQAQYGEFPWMVAILTEEKKRDIDKIVNVYLCGGSLIHPNVVLTAAHCVDSFAKRSLKIRAGEWDTQTTNELWIHQDRIVTNVLIHDDFYKPALRYDAALLILKLPVDLVGNVKTICLPPYNYAFDSHNCVASGWGKNIFGKEGEYQAILKKIELPIIEHKKCLNLLRKTRLGRYFQLHKSFLCAGGIKGVDTCKGDGGSPLVCPIPGEFNRYYQAGIVAWGIGCGDEKIPGVYVDVRKLRNWIDGYFTKHNLSMNYYI